MIKYADTVGRLSQKVYSLKHVALSIIVGLRDSLGCFSHAKIRDWHWQDIGRTIKRPWV